MRHFNSIITRCYHNLNHTRPLVSQLKSRSVIRFSGPDTVKYLQGLLTNDVRRFGGPPIERTSNVPTPNRPAVSEPPMYAALLTAQGRFLYDFFLYRCPRNGEKLDGTGLGPGPNSGGPLELFADVDASLLDEILQTLKKYRLRSKVEIDDVAGDFSCWQRFGGNLDMQSGAMEEPEAASVGWGSGVDGSVMSASHGNAVGWRWLKDPRLDCLGFRGIFPSDKTPPLVEANKETDEQNYLLWRIETGVAEGSSEIQKELQQNVAPGSEVFNTISNKKVGSVTTALCSRGLGLLRLDEAFKETGCLAIQGQKGIKVETIRPKWWPTEWFLENQEHSVMG